MRHRQIAELGFAVLIKEIRSHLPDWQPEYITFRHTRPSDERYHARFLGPSIEYDADRNAIFFTKAQLAAPTREGSAQVHDQLARRYRRLRATTEGALASATESLVRVFMPDTTIDLARAANLPVQRAQSHPERTPLSA